MTTRDHIKRVLNSPGPIADRFMLSRAFIKTIIGPVGSGKSIAALRALVEVGKSQHGVKDNNGVLWRKARVGVIRETYPNLEKNTVKSWFRIFAETDGAFTWKAPFTHKLTLILAVDDDGNATDVCEFEIEFRAIGDQSVEEVTRGWEVNAVMIDEADLQPPELLGFLTGRVGRFSDLDPNLVVDPQIILCCNMPYTDNWMYRLAFENDLGALDDPELKEALGGRPLIEVFVQPSGFSPHAENLHNLPKGYYTIQKAANKARPDYVARMLENKPVPMQYGQPVNPQFSYETHVRSTVEYDPNRLLTVGIDQGLNAAAVFTQRGDENQLRTLAETVLLKDDGKLRKVGGKAFAQALKATQAQHFPDHPPELVRYVADPAAWSADDNEDQGRDWVRIVEKELGAKLNKAKSNKPALRNEAIWSAMGETGMYEVHPRCKHLIKGHLGGYRYQKAEMAQGEKRGHLTIAKTAHSHVCDGEQYAALEGDGIIAGLRGEEVSDDPFEIEDEFDVFA